MASSVLIRGVLAKGNTWSDWYPYGLKMSGAVVGNRKFKRGTWYHRYPDGTCKEVKTR